MLGDKCQQKDSTNDDDIKSQSSELGSCSCSVEPAVSFHVDMTLNEELCSSLEDIDTETTDRRWQAASACLPSDEAASSYKRIMRNGLLGLLGQTCTLETQAWQDAMLYCRSVIDKPQDTPQRANALWARSCSDVSSELKNRFGPGIVSAARAGCVAVAVDHFRGRSLDIAHTDKKANFQRYFSQVQAGAAFYPKDSTLAIASYEIGVMPCSLILSAWLSPKDAVKAGAIACVAICDDYGGFTISERHLRLRMVALAVGAAYELGGRATSALLDATSLQAVGVGDQVSIRAAMAWRAVAGAATIYNGYIFGSDSLEEGLIAPEVMMAMHDLYDWRCDMAAGNPENGVTAICGLRLSDPFHVYLEAMLRRASFHSISGVHAISGLTFSHFTSTRYGAYNYVGTVPEMPCPECLRLTVDITRKGRLAWAPKQPPRTFAEGSRARQLGKTWMDRFEDHGLVQESFSWFQHLVATNQIRLFDVFVPMDQVDPMAEWV